MIRGLGNYVTKCVFSVLYEKGRVKYGMRRLGNDVRKCVFGVVYEKRRVKYGD